VHFDASSIFILALTAAAVVAVALMNIYGRDRDAPPPPERKMAAPSDPLRSKERPRNRRNSGVRE